MNTTRETGAAGTKLDRDGSWLARRLMDGLVLAGAVALALPLILPFG